MRLLRHARAAWQLYRLVRILLRSRAPYSGSSITIVAESERRFAARQASGDTDPRYEGCEVTVWQDVTVKAKVYRGWTLDQALKRAVDAAPSSDPSSEPFLF